MREVSANILLRALDDDMGELEILSLLCEEYHVQMKKFYTEENKFIDETGPDINVILVDHILPLTTGLEVTKKVKDKNRDNYVIVSTGIMDFDIAVQYLKAGANDWVKKNNINYREDLKIALRKGFEIARKRIDEANKLKMLEHTTLESMDAIGKLAVKLNYKKAI